MTEQQAIDEIVFEHAFAEACQERARYLTIAVSITKNLANAEDLLQSVF